MELKKGYKQTDVGVIPEDWHIRKLGDLGDVKMCRRIFNHETKPSGEIPFFKIGTFGKEPDAYISEELFNDYKKRFSYPERGQILISAAGTIGRTVVYNGERSYFQDSNIIWISNKQEIISDSFLIHILKVVKFTTEGGTIQRLYNSILKNTLFICPTGQEQTAIANALSDTDAYITSLEKLIEKKHQIKQGAMQELLKPKDGWETKTLKEVATYRRGSFPQPYGLDKWYDDISGFPFVQVFDVDDNNRLKDETKRRISKLAQQMSVFVKKGSIILTIQGSIGRIALTQYDAYVDRTLLIFEAFKVPFDLYFFMISIWRIFEIEKELAPGGIIKTITKEALSSFKISYPNIVEQNRIATILSEIDEDILALENKLIKAKYLKQGMMQNLLTGKIRLI